MSLRAKLVALRTLAPADAARVLAAMAPEARAEAEAGLDPETVGLAPRLVGSTPEEPPLPEYDSSSALEGSKENREGDASAKVSNREGFEDAFAASNDCGRRAALEVLDDSETYVYMGDVEGEGGWTRDDGAATNGSDDFV